MTAAFDKAARLAPKIPDLTCQHIDAVLDDLSDAMGLLDWVPMDQAASAYNILAELRGDDGALERLRAMNDALRRSAAYWRKVAKEQAARIEELEQPVSAINWTHVVR